MGNVVFYMSMSLDGFVTARDLSPEKPLGVGGDRLHDWAVSSTDPQGAEVLRRSIESSGAIIVGRRTYDESIQGWGANGPTGEARVPVIVLTHRPDPPPPEDGVYTFVTGGVESAVNHARAQAGDKDVAMSGVDVPRQLLQDGYVDEIWTHIVPVLFGDGTRLYENPGGSHIELELIEAIPTAKATHLHYRVQHSGTRDSGIRARS